MMPRLHYARPVGLLLLMLWLALARPAFAQGPARPGEPPVPEKAGKELEAYYVGDRAPRIDGHLDDEIWAQADAIDDMVQNDPDNMTPPTERTLVKVAYDDRSIFVGVVNYMKDPSKVTTALGRRDTNPRSDQIRISFDPRHDHLTAYTFESNPSGVQSDMSWFDDSRSSSDYDAVWEVRTQRTAEGWTAEFRIPFSQMRFSLPDAEAVVWGFNIRRDIVGRAEVDRWVATPRGAQGFVSRFGHLTFAKAPAPPRRLEVQPFLLGRQEHVTDAGYGRDLSGGIDFRMGLGTSTNLSAAVNPDFGQVEQDPAVLNLSVFETFFPEKRPFFIEDSRSLVASYGQMPMFHSRRIGQRPGRFAVPEGETVIERPDATTILGATKVTGKARGWSYGGLTALTDREYAVVESTAAGSDRTVRGERLIEPYTSYNVGRIQKDLGGGSTVGGTGTAVLREQDLDAYTGAIDYTVRWAKNRYNWNGQWATTRAPISGVMQTGFGGVTNLNYSGKHLGMFGRYEYFDRDFRNADLGFFFGRNNKTLINAGFNLGQPDPTRYFRSATLFSNVFTQFNGDRLALDKSLFVGGEIQFLNYWHVFVGTSRTLQTYDDLDTRGGPPIVKPAGWFLNGFVGSDSRKRLRGSVGTNLSGNEAHGWSRGVNADLRYQPVPQLQTTLSAQYNFAEDAAQWITNEDVTGDGEIDHVYGRLHRNVVSVTARSTYAFTRDMTLEVYLQPFVAAGDYTDIRRLARPKSYDFEPAAVSDNPDFNRKSLRSNVVFRWEYKRGSTVYLVWNVSNSDSARPGEFSAFRDLRTGFGAAGTQVFMVKLNYWLGL
ncbi:MAG: DUF5916 domain-containing protein [Vicinamibacterales bacterium]